MNADPFQIDPRFLGTLNQGMREALTLISGKNCRQGIIHLALAEKSSEET